MGKIRQDSEKQSKNWGKEGPSDNWNLTKTANSASRVKGASFEFFNLANHWQITLVPRVCSCANHLSKNCPCFPPFSHFTIHAFDISCLYPCFCQFELVIFWCNKRMPILENATCPFHSCIICRRVLLGFLCSIPGELLSGLHTSNCCWPARVDKLKSVRVNKTITCW